MFFKILLSIIISTFCFEAFSQTDSTMQFSYDTVVVEEAPIVINHTKVLGFHVIKKKSQPWSVSISTDFSKNIHQNTAVFSEKAFNKTAVTFQYKIQKVTLGIGIGMLTSQLNVKSIDPVSKKVITPITVYDTLDTYLQTVNGITTKYYVIDTLQTTKTSNQITDSVSSKYHHLSYAIVPLTFQYHFQKLRWSFAPQFSFITGISTNIKELKMGNVLTKQANLIFISSINLNINYRMSENYSVYGYLAQTNSLSQIFKGVDYKLNTIGLGVGINYFL